ncbi:MAG: serine hydrolase, partial [bacterium]
MNRLFLSLILMLIVCLNSCSPGNKDNSSSSSKGESVSANELVDYESVIGVNINRYLSAMETLGFSGAIIVSKGDELVLRKGYGLADRETRRPYTSNTIQSCGSITKQFT